MHNVKDIYALQYKHFAVLDSANTAYKLKIKEALLIMRERAALLSNQIITIGH